jgi:hypothetical protein
MLSTRLGAGGLLFLAAYFAFAFFARDSFGGLLVSLLLRIGLSQGASFVLRCTVGNERNTRRFLIGFQDINLRLANGSDGRSGCQFVAPCNGSKSLPPKQSAPAIAEPPDLVSGNFPQADALLYGSLWRRQSQPVRK